MDTETFRVFWEMSEPGHAAEKCFIRTPQYEHYFEDLSHPRGLETMPDVCALRINLHTIDFSQFEIMSKSELIPGAVFGISFTAISFGVDYIFAPVFNAVLIHEIRSNRVPGLSAQAVPRGWRKARAWLGPAHQASR